MVSERKRVWEVLVGSTETHKQKKTNSEKGQKEMVRIQMPERYGDRKSFVSMK